MYRHQRSVRTIENRRSIGTKYEEVAAKYLTDSGYRILEKNFYSHHGEIDLVAMDKDTLVFIEVKYRKNSKFGYPWEAVDLRKQRRIQYGAAYYMRSHHISPQTKCRFDVVSVTGHEIQLYKNAFIAEKSYI